MRYGTLDVDSKTYGIMTGQALVSNRSEFIGFGCFYDFKDITNSTSLTANNSGINIYKF